MQAGCCIYANIRTSTLIAKILGSMMVRYRSKEKGVRSIFNWCRSDGIRYMSCETNSNKRGIKYISTNFCCVHCWAGAFTGQVGVRVKDLRWLPGDIGEIFSETILQLLSLGHHIRTRGHQLLYGGLQLIKLGHHLLCGSLQLITGGNQIITGGHQLW